MAAILKIKMAQYPHFFWNAITYMYTKFDAFISECTILLLSRYTSRVLFVTFNLAITCS